VYATTVNRTDYGFRKPEYPLIILGSELAGEIEAVGVDVRSFKKGDQVFGLTGDNFGAHAEYVCLPEGGSIVAKPSTMSYEEAAAVCDGLMFAFNYLRSIDVQRGQTILINGASGSTGSARMTLCSMRLARLRSFVARS
jgi:NADPH:quinone reductase-like Zn-dependent oxidoreductase